MALSNQGLDKALTIVARMFAEQAGIEVRRGNRASTNGRVIILPKCDDLALTEEEVALNLGFLFHETGHILHTDFSDRQFQSPLHHTICNILEDVRIEDRVAQDYRTTRRHFSQTVATLLKRGSFAATTDEDKPATVFQTYLAYNGRSNILGQTILDERAAQATDVANRMFGKVMMLKTEVLLNRVARCKNTKDVKLIADELLKLIQDHVEEEEELPQQSQGNASDDSQGDQEGQGGGSGQQDGQQGQGQDSGSGQSQDQNQDQTQDPSHGQSQDASQGQNQNSSQGAGQGKGKGKGKGRTQSQSKGKGAGHGSPQKQNLQSLLDMADEDMQEGIGEMLARASNEAAAEHPPQRDLKFPDVVPHGLLGGEVDLDGIRASSNAIRAKLLQWKTSAEYADEYLTKTGMKFDRRVMWGAKVGKKIFKKSEDGLDLEAAISVVIDRSGSMCGRPIKEAIKACVSTALAFDHPQIQHQVIAFPYGDDDDDVAIIKKWSEKSRQLASRIGGMSASGGTPMAGAILFSGACLAARPEKRKIMLVITDGDPNDRMAAIDAVKLARQNGLEVLGLGIGCPTKHIFGNQGSSIRGIDELAPTMISQLKSAFTRT